jgi:hypothetical protein
MIAPVSRLNRALVPIVTPDWEAWPWRDKPTLVLRHWMGDCPEHRPPTQVRLAYDSTAIFIIFRVEDRYVRAVATTHQGRVWEDSCVEFFFSPTAEPHAGYFNLEMNCGGTMLFHFQQEPRKNPVAIRSEDLAQITVAHSLPHIVNPEIPEPLCWTLAYRLPFDLLRNYTHILTPAPGVSWRANFYKCGDLTSHPHWLTWAKIDWPKPDFHRPEFFGWLTFGAA